MAICPLWSRTECVLAWSEIDFVSPTPAVEHMQGGWRFRDLGLPPGWDILRDRSFFVIDVVVHDRHNIGRRWQSMRSPKVHALLSANDEPEPLRGFFSEDIHLSRLSSSASSLLQLMAEHSRYELFCHTD
jgi:hypothetical protein